MKIHKILKPFDQFSPRISKLKNWQKLASVGTLGTISSLIVSSVAAKPVFAEVVKPVESSQFVTSLNYQKITSSSILENNHLTSNQVSDFDGNLKSRLSAYIAPELFSDELNPDILAQEYMRLLEQLESWSNLHQNNSQYLAQVKSILNQSSNIANKPLTSSDIDLMRQNLRTLSVILDPHHVVVQSGDTLWDISHRQLGEPTLWNQIHQNNPQIDNPDLIFPGDVIGLTGVQNLPAVKVFEPEQVNAFAGLFCAVSQREENTPQQRVAALDSLGLFISHVLAPSSIEMSQQITSKGDSMKDLLTPIISVFNLPLDLIPQTTGTLMYQINQEQNNAIFDARKKAEYHQLSQEQKDEFGALGNRLLEVSGQGHFNCGSDFPIFNVPFPKTTPTELERKEVLTRRRSLSIAT